MERRIDFLVIGAPKSGTTTLHVALSLHPQIRVPSRGGKELRHFDAPPERDVLSEAALERYHSAWDWHESGVLRGEASPGYLACPEGAERMRRYRQDLRLIAILRAPSTRAYSSWNMDLQKGLERRSFDRAVRDELAGDTRSAHVAAGLYATQLERLLCAWPDARLLVLRTEELAVNPNDTLHRACDFLGVSRHDYSRLRARHVRLHVGAMHPATADLLRRVYEDEIDRLEVRFGWNLVSWKRPRGSTAAWLVGESLRRSMQVVPGVWPFAEQIRSQVARFRSPWGR
jgi:hypothetical protein